MGVLFVKSELVYASVVCNLLNGYAFILNLVGKRDNNFHKKPKYLREGSSLNRSK